MNVYRVNNELYAAERLNDAVNLAYENWSYSTQASADKQHETAVAAAEAAHAARVSQAKAAHAARISQAEEMGQDTTKFVAPEFVAPPPVTVDYTRERFEDSVLISTKLVGELKNSLA